MMATGRLCAAPVVKQREYLKLDGQGYAHTAPQDLYRLPAASTR